MDKVLVIFTLHSVLARGFTKIANLDINRLKFIFWSSISIIAH